ncbi:hypothetical protein KAFR_0B06640 [Kazachstania africana CBS 2517]|uniref:Zinc finger PHD-type domain-containing protein n=1 Tax=Kazachstania africana (strain ATCC 22294 / BCRC 22015 / CBS 2517 / CECT 1963 / NBRC 1671 / NRRL Y-8276) TaxID=1071382 RepID=H2ARG1_KAZAF|nr:hypothetical protein KAFR_0B06640 [Kazachstania africana CBS 2517]CCF56961.1 hypothetical protein KAFR_0B06640 [Kazachstania africana CBS 2517]
MSQGEGESAVDITETVSMKEENAPPVVGKDVGTSDADALIPEEIEEEEEQEEEEEGETRCVCGEIDPPDESGLYIQCESCSVWQHGFCVGIVGGSKDAPDKYWCELCKPTLHHLYLNDLGEKRSIYKPVQEKKRQNRRTARSGKNGGGSVGGESSSESNGSGSSSSSTGSSKDTNNITNVVKGEEEEKRLQDRKRATFLAREEKQYQRMLEKAIKESRRTSKQEDFPLTEDAEADSPDTLTDPVHELLDSEKREVNENTNHEDMEDINEEEDEVEEDQDQKSSINETSTNASSDNLASAKKPSPNAKITKPARRSNRSHAGILDSRASSRSRRGTRKMDNKNSSIADNEIDVNKPVKPRIPSERTSINEMKRRTKAILEFISRTQLEINDDIQNKNKLTKFVENDDFLKKLDVIYINYSEHLVLMDEITQKLISWEDKYSNFI